MIRGRRKQFKGNESNKSTKELFFKLSVNLKIACFILMITILQPTSKINSPTLFDLCLFLSFLYL